MLSPRAFLPAAAALFFGLLLAACERPQEQEQDATQDGGEQSAADATDAGADIAAQVPDTEIFLGELTWQDAAPIISQIHNITNRTGYDNQPKFLPDGESLVFSSIRDGKQSDIYRYLIADKLTVPYAMTPESEYSPTPIPGGNGISVVRVEADGTQRLWRFAAANAKPSVLFADVEAVGYHAWLSESQAAMFIVAEPPLLLLADQQSGVRQEVSSNIGRSLARMPGDDGLAFIDKEEEAVWRIARYDLKDGSLSELIAAPGGSEDFAWSQNGGLFMADASKLLYWNGHADSQWQPVAGFPAEFDGRITRIDVARDLSRLAFVAEVE